MKKRDKIIYWTSTVLLSAMTLMGATYYFVNNPMVSDMFAQLGYPSYLVYPLGIAKYLAIIAILTRKSKLLADFAYAGLFYTFILGAVAHIQAEVGSAGGALVALVLLIVSYYYSLKLEKTK